MLFVCAVLFTIVWWNIPHSRTNWLPTFVFLIILSVIVFFYASRGAVARCKACAATATTTQPPRCAPKNSFIASQCFSAAASS